MSRPVPLLGWDAPRAEWLAARTSGIGASDVAALLGFSKYRSPWRVWAEKTGQPLPPDETSPAAQLGIDLEPWLLSMAPRLLGRPVRRTEAQLYRHATVPHHLCSPDGEDGTGLVECKTGGLLGYGTPEGWTETDIPLGYEFQARWQMYVMDVPYCHVVGLVAGLGVVLYTYERDLPIELDLVGQVNEAWDRHIVGGIEPAYGAADAGLLAARYPVGAGETDLDGTDAESLCRQYIAARDAEKAAKATKEDIGARLKGLLGDHEKGLLAGRTAVAWGARKGDVDWEAVLTDCGDPDIDLDAYRKPSTRTLTVKKLV